MSVKKSWITYLFTLLVAMFMSLQCLRYFSEVNKRITNRERKVNLGSQYGNNSASIDLATDEEEHSRQKRFLFFTSDRKLALPAGTGLSFSISINVVPWRNPPTGYSASLTIGYNFNIDLDGLGYASDENPWFVLPFFYFNGGGPEGDSVPGVNLAGGDRVVMYEYLEGIMESIGLLGKPCVQRAICEIFQGPLRDHGFLGEALKLFFTVSRAPFAEERLGDYLAAEKSGKETGDCSFYEELCMHSLFADVPANPPKLIPVSKSLSDDVDAEQVPTSDDLDTKPKSVQDVSNTESNPVPDTSDADPLPDDDAEEKEEEELNRQKRFIYITRNRRIRFPPDSLFFFITSVSVPFRGNIPQGFGIGGLSISVPLQVVLDDLGLTSEENPFGNWPFLNELFAEETEDVPRRRRHAISRKSDPQFPGGDRDMLYAIAEDAIEKAGLAGKACLLRAICEMFQYPLDNHGFLGEFLELFFSASLSPNAEKRLPEYLAAERAGKTTGKCFQYHQDCPYSLFTNPMDANTFNEEAMKKDFSRETPWIQHSVFSLGNMAAALIEYLENWL